MRPCADVALCWRLMRRQEHWEAAAACEAAQEAAAAAAEEKARLLTELQDAREALRAATDGAAGCHDIEAAELAAQLKVGRRSCCHCSCGLDYPLSQCQPEMHLIL